MSKSQRFFREKWFWRVMTVVVTVIALVLPEEWAKYGVIYVAFVSNYALDLTCAGAHEAARAKEKYDEDKVEG